MRLWHKDLIEVLPSSLLIWQWRDCCDIARSIATDGAPNDILVFRMTDYQVEEFWAFAKLVCNEMRRRGYKCDFYDFSKWYSGYNRGTREIDKIYIFPEWHNKRYLWQCYSYLEELYDCGEILAEEWILIEDRMRKVVGV